jgi:hypothetical protein
LLCIADDDTYGQFFHSKHYPNLKFFIHTGFDIEMGCISYKSLFLHNPITSAVDSASQATKDDTPFYAQVTLEGGSAKVGALKTQAQALDLPALAFAKKLVGNQYFETP